ncbi:hypothetical protein CVT26_014250 [Gymnopilus dilepis]|uniref:Uncharacterized protein n=1 Tax=Gymnopilus dilepis TaxID=231916 RepID=A0A409VXG9_9AGAR|nr:hypothetical protein CVT26_014250 [Gymnopilus dilepis]
MDSQFVIFSDFAASPTSPLRPIKEEATDQQSSLISPPVTPSPPSFTSPSVSSTSNRRRGSTSHLAGQARHRPYPPPSIQRDSTVRKEELGTMSNSSAYGWNSSASRSGHGRHHVERRSPEGEDQTAYTLPQFMNGPFPDMRPLSSSSSLVGAMGEASISSHSRHSHSPPSSTSGNVYPGNMQDHASAWNHTQMNIALTESVYPGVPGHGGLSFAGLDSSNLDIPLNDYSTSRHASPESLSPHSPNYFNEYAAYGTSGRGQFLPQQPTAPMHSTPVYSADDVARLQHRIRELEQECRRTKKALEMAQGQSGHGHGLPGVFPSPAFQASWKARTEIRKKIFCSLNRAGNALCAWHDSRRERRIYPPRNAPPGYLNCGCSFEEALFEESLARHGVGSYHPGETVRMDPALRNPLLKLLQKRYGYKDGDFEHDPITEQWFEGESPEAWEQKSTLPLKRRTDNDRH